MRKPKEKPQVDLTVPVDIDVLKSDDPCFGELWDPRDNNCAVCHAIEVCGILYQEKIKTKKRSFEKEHGPMLDQEQYAHVNFDTVATSIQKAADKGQFFTVEDLKYTVATLAKCKDDTSTMEYIRRMLPKYNMTIQNNLITIYGQGTDNHKTTGGITP